MQKRERLHAVHDDDLEQYLISLGLIGDLRAGRLHCKFCGDAVTLATLDALLPESGSINVVCTKPACQKEMMRLLGER